MKNSQINYQEIKNKYPEIFTKKGYLRGMTFMAGKRHSFFVISDNSNYRDKTDQGYIEYDGHNKWGDIEGKLDQETRYENSNYNQNGLFINEYKKLKNHNTSNKVIVKVLRKIVTGTWEEMGYFAIKDIKYIFDGFRKKFVFYCFPIDFDETPSKLNNFQNDNIPW